LETVNTIKTIIRDAINDKHKTSKRYEIIAKRLLDKGEKQKARRFQEMSEEEGGHLNRLNVIHENLGRFRVDPCSFKDGEKVSTCDLNILFKEVVEDEIKNYGIFINLSSIISAQRPPKYKSMYRSVIAIAHDAKNHKEYIQGMDNLP